jgi:hypothetical protein
MPRGDGKKEGSARIRKVVSGEQYVPKKLATRIAWWQTDFREGNGYTEKDKHDGRGNSFRKPGSQNKRK